MTHEFKKQTMTKEKLNIPDDGMINLHDLTFDFDSYFNNHAELSEEEQDEFQCRVMGQFCKEFFESGGDPSAISPWVASYIAEAFYQVLGGVPFNHVLPTPFEPMQDRYSAKGRRAMDVYCEVENAVRQGEKVTVMFARIAARMSVSPQTISAAYYGAKNAIDAGESLPEKFLKNDGNF